MLKANRRHGGQPAREADGNFTARRAHRFAAAQARPKKEGETMIFADKLIELRKKNGWSQEELAEKLNVTRQSVSKWEGAQSIPELAKILQMAQLFDVTTDYLLRDEIEQPQSEENEEWEQPARRRVTLEQADAFLRVKQETGKWIALGVALCILSPVCLILLAAASEAGWLPFGENAAAGLGMVILLLMVALAVAMFILCGGKTKAYEFLERELFETEYGVSGMVRERQKQYHDIYTRYNMLGVCGCILAVVPLFAGLVFSENEFFLCGMMCLMFALLSVSVAALIVVGINWASMEKLLEEGDYTRGKKQENVSLAPMSTVYWTLATALFLVLGFSADSPEGWHACAIVWPIAGVLFVPARVICSAFLRRRK